MALDLEATCDENKKIPARDMEIIEIGAVLLDDAYNTIDEFQTFVKPTLNPILTDFCKQLTHINQIDVDQAPSIKTAFNMLSKWLMQHHPFVWCSWGDYDVRQFNRDCDRTGASWPIPGKHFNAKTKFSTHHNIKKMGLRQAVEYMGLEWLGTHHRGIDDARNLARLLQYMK